MHRVILAPLLAMTLVLAACAPASQKVAGFRKTETPIWSAAAFAPGQIVGDWRQVAAHAARPDGCAAGGLTITPTGAGLRLDGTLCLNGQTQRIATTARPIGPGRLAVEGMEDWWILWVDSGYRTLAIGTPSGRFGFVLDRGAPAPDRLAAARELFDFNGYIPAAFRPL